MRVLSVCLFPSPSPTHATADIQLFSGAGGTEIEVVTEIGVGTDDANETATENVIAIEVSELKTGNVPENKYHYRQ